MIRVLITSIGGLFSYDTVRALRKTNKSIFVLGVDINPKVNYFFLDKFETVPKVEISEIKYIKTLIKICKIHKIKYLIPCSDNESLVISKYFDEFKKIGIKLSVSKYKIAKTMTDKAAMFQYLTEKGIDVGEWRKVNSINDIEKEVKFFKKNKIQIIIKPRKGSGSRGVLIIDESKKKFKDLLDDKTRFCGIGSWKSIKAEIKNRKASLKENLIMPYHNNDTYDVDCLAKDGQLVLCIPRLRVYDNPLSPTNQGCIIKSHKQIKNYCSKIIRAFNVNGACDFDVVIRKDGKPQILDASCRLSGSSGASLSIGINVPNSLLRIMSEKSIKPLKLKKTYRVFPKSRFVVDNNFK